MPNCVAARKRSDPWPATGRRLHRRCIGGQPLEPSVARGNDGQFRHGEEAVQKNQQNDDDDLENAHFLPLEYRELDRSPSPVPGAGGEFDDFRSDLFLCKVDAHPRRVPPSLLSMLVLAEAIAIKRAWFSASKACVAASQSCAYTYSAARLSSRWRGASVVRWCQRFNRPGEAREVDRQQRMPVHFNAPTWEGSGRREYRPSRWHRWLPRNSDLVEDSPWRGIAGCRSL